MIRVRAHVNVAGLRAGNEYELPADHPGLASAIAGGLVEDLTPVRRTRARKQETGEREVVVRESEQADGGPVTARVSTDGGGGSGEGDAEAS